MEKEELKKIISNLQKKHGKKSVFVISTGDDNIYIGAVKLNGDRVEITESPKDKESISCRYIIAITHKSNIELAGIINALRGHISLHCGAVETAVKEMGKSMKGMGLGL